MKKYYSLCILSVILLSFFPFSAKSQTDGFVCGTDAARQRLIQQHPEILEAEKALEQYTQKYVAEYLKQNASRSIPDDNEIIIPLVFHIIHQGGPENISDAQVIDEVRILNRDYNKQNADTSDVQLASFRKIIANMNIQFRLANLAPDSTCTNGIDRIYSVQTFSGGDYAKLNTWPRERYMNVWLVSSLGGNAAGYAYYPSSVSAVYNTPNQDGVIILHPYIGSIGTGAVFRSRALTHEIGHCFNLKHCWGDSNEPGVACGDDDVDDTPKTKGWLGCSDTGTNPATGIPHAAICDPTIIENFQNYMEYSYCSRMFTLGQKARARAALDTSIASRNNLWDSTNLVFTGVANGFVKPCAPKADFYPSTRYVCLNGYATLFANPANGSADSYLWDIPNGAPSSDTSRNPKIQFLSPGWQTIRLILTNAYGADTIIDNQRVYVGYDNALAQAPYFEGFEDPNVFNDPAGWASVNYDENNTFFSQAPYPHTGSGSARLNNYFARADHDVDEIISPAIDMTQLTQPNMGLSFFYSWASGNGNFNSQPDSIAVMASTDCGVTWNRLYSNNGAAVLGYWQGEWTPTTESGVWKKVTIPLSSANAFTKYHQPNVRFKIQVLSSVGGNDFYIDDINIGNAITAVEETSALTDVTLFPNPSSGQVNLNLQLAKACKVTVKVLDIAGKEVLNAYQGQMNEGENVFQLNNNDILAKGVYIVSIQAGESSMQKKLVIQ